MGVLAKLFKRSPGSRQESARKDRSGHAPTSIIGGADSTIEPKPLSNGSPADQSDQAARLRQAVLSANAEATVARQHADALEDDDDDPDFDAADFSEHRITDSSPDDDPSADGAPEPIAADGAALSRKPRSPRSKQELIEELHRNYQEVLGLIRKLDGHLDDARGRSETIAQVAEQYAKIAPVIESLPDRLTERTDQLSTDIRKSIGEEGAAARELLERIESAIVHVGTDIERSTDQQGRLVQTMAEFRESLTDLSRSSTAACESVRDSESRAAQRDQALLTQLRQTRLWLIGLTVGVGAIGVAAIILGVIALRA